MDFGVASHKHPSPNLGSTEPRDENSHGSVNLKHQRSELSEDSWRLPKMPRPGEVDFSSKNGRSNLFDDGQKMLSFSSPTAGMAASGSSRSIAFSVCQDDHHSRTGGVRGGFARLKGPFTPSQWMELEHQALIYKHILANVPVPSNLLMPLKRSLYSYGSSGSYASNFLGWGPFHLGFSGSNDPEPGRCRRTDGKKWRCSRDAVPDQKYCERHINRGRHRSRKPVEGQTGHAVVSGSTTRKVAPIAASSSSASVISSTSPSISLSAAAAAMHHHNFTSFIPPKEPSFSLQKGHVPFNESSPSQSQSHSEFGIVSTDSLLNPSVHHFIDDWPKDDQSDELKSDWTQLSMSIPVAPDFSSSSSSPSQEKSTVSTLRLSHELDPIHMSLGMSLDEPMQKQMPWLPVSWGSSMGGPLGEVLISTSGAGIGGSCSNVKTWRTSPQMGSSPTGVLQKSSFVSLSNSSSGSSPPSIDDKKASENGSLCTDLLGSALVSSAAIPSL